MGNSQPIQSIQLNETYEKTLLEATQQINLTDHKNKMLFSMFTMEYNILCNKWNNGTIAGSDFDKCSIIAKYIIDPRFKVVYNDFINKWNNGTIKGSDFNFLSLYILKCTT